MAIFNIALWRDVAQAAVVAITSNMETLRHSPKRTETIPSTTIASITIAPQIAKKQAAAPSSQFRGLLKPQTLRSSRPKL